MGSRHEEEDVNGCNDHDALTIWCACGYDKPELLKSRVASAARKVFAAQQEYDEAMRSGDDFDIIHASLALTTAERDYERRVTEQGEG
jgi:hypothetical protein